MPLINGLKYSCEPCIRGHRATSCAHTDRVLVEVRKPGRPLQSCGHRLDTCVCGRLSELFKIGDILPDSTENQHPQNPRQPFVTPQSQSVPPAGKSKDRSSANSTSKVTKRSRKRLVSPTTSEATTSEKAVVLEDENEAHGGSRGQPPIQHSEVYPGHLTPNSSTSMLSPNDYSQRSGIPTPTTTPNTPLPGVQNFVYGRDGHYTDRTREIQDSPALQPRDSQSIWYSSRIEDVSIISPRNSTPLNLISPESQQMVRSQYIVARQDSTWRSNSERRR